jgi:CTP synthase (UTP-ammonia lyase)
MPGEATGADVVSNVRIGLIGDYDAEVPAHRAIPMALKLAADTTGVIAEAVWVHTSTLGVDVAPQLAEFAGLWCVPASPYANTAGALAAIGFARESGRPYLGTCGGFQHALMEYARNVLAMRDADHAELHPDAAVPLIAPLDCALVEQTGSVNLADGSRLRAIYGRAEVEEPYHCRYGLNPQYEHLFAGTPLRVAARDRAGEVRAVELNGHPFFIATLYQPERSALRGEGHPLVTAFVSAAAERPAVIPARTPSGHG